MNGRVVFKLQIAVNEKGYRIGESHPCAKLTNNEVESMLQMRDEGFGYKRLARMFDVSSATARNIVKGRKRSQVIAGWKMVLIEGGQDGNEES